jgi:hypothetical protein
MRTFLVVPIVLFTIYLIANYFLNPQYNSASFRDFLVASIQPITWACGLFCLGLAFDFARRASSGDTCKQVHGSFFLWSVTYALFLQLLLVGVAAVMVASGPSALIGALNGYEANILYQSSH